MFVSGIPFLVTFLKKIRMITAKYTPSCTAQQVANSLTKIVNTYAHRGFVIDLTLMEMLFEEAKDKLTIVEVNTSASREHVLEIKPQIRLIKEHVRCTTSNFLFNPIPRMVLIHVLYMCVMWLNAIPRIAGAVQGISHQ